jgi:anti-anti-sigma factor
VRTKAAPPTRWIGMTGGRRFRRHPVLDADGIQSLPPSSCRIMAETHSGTAVFRLKGKLDSVTAAEVSLALAPAAGEETVLLDLSDVAMIDAEGERALRDVIRSVHKLGGRVAISRPRRVADQIPHLLGAQGFVYLALSPASAIAWLIQSGDRLETEAIAV